MFSEIMQWETKNKLWETNVVSRLKIYTIIVLISLAVVLMVNVFMLYALTVVRWAALQRAVLYYGILRHSIECAHTDTHVQCHCYSVSQCYTLILCFTATLYVN